MSKELSIGVVGLGFGAVHARVLSTLEGVRLAELRRDQDVLARLVPEVVVERRLPAAVLPAAVMAEVLKQVAELLLQVQTAEDAKALRAENAREVADERRP